ncbi:MAG: NUDIX domain-containing protein [Desulforhabdus sp.]|nr:NUDIX domain-containing protein [Desulforhabdus sp.]
MPKQSAGLLMYRRRKEGIQVLLVHPGGPYWANKDLGVWSIPKGEYAEGEDPLETARREFREETGTAAFGQFLPLTPIKQAGGKRVQAWAFEGDLNASSISSNTFSMQWPPRSGKQQTFPEVDRAEWFTIDTARIKIRKGQAALLDELLAILAKT